MTILSVSKEETRSIYSVEKSSDFWKKARQLLSNLGIQGISARTFGTKNAADLEILKMKDEQQGFKIDRDSNLDFIIGSERVFIIFSYKKDMHAKFAKIFYEVFK